MGCRGLPGGLHFLPDLMCRAWRSSNTRDTLDKGKPGTDLLWGFHNIEQLLSCFADRHL